MTMAAVTETVKKPPSHRIDLVVTLCSRKDECSMRFAFRISLSLSSTSSGPVMLESGEVC